MRLSKWNEILKCSPVAQVTPLLLPDNTFYRQMSYKVKSFLVLTKDTVYTFELNIRLSYNWGWRVGAFPRLCLSVSTLLVPSVSIQVNHKHSPCCQQQVLISIWFRHQQSHSLNSSCFGGYFLSKQDHETSAHMARHPPLDAQLFVLYIHSRPHRASY